MKKNHNRLSLSETVFIAILSSALGIAWWAYSFIYNIISPLLKTIGISGLLEGFWHIGGIFFAFIIRKPGSAVLGETIAAGVEGVISQWGFSAIVSGLCQGIPVEIVFLICRYRLWNKYTCMLGGMASALGGYLVTYYWYGYNHFSFWFNVLNLSCNLLSGALLGGLLSYYLALQLANSGVLNHYRIALANK